MICTHRRCLAIGATTGLALTLATTQPVAAGAWTYVVRPHDTLSGIAAAFGTTVHALEVANGLHDDGYIVPGQVLTRPSPAPLGAASVSTCRPTARRSPHDDDARDRWAHATMRWEQRTCRVGQPLSAPASTAPPALPAAAAPVPTTSVSPTPVPTASVSATPVPPVAPTPVPSVGASGSVAALLTAQAQAAGVDPALVKAVAWQESGWQMITSADGGFGIMQLMPATVTWAEATLLGQSLDPTTPADNVRAGVAVLRYYLMVFGNERLAIAAYHQGLRSVQTEGVSAATAHYVANVLALQRQFAQ